MTTPKGPAGASALPECDIMKYILASMSPRRSEILTEMGLEFEVCPADIDENIGLKDPEMLVKQLALLKAGCIAKKHSGENKVIIAADTVVAYKNEILGKPKDEKDAERMLKMLSGNTHTVYTGYCCADAKTGLTVARCEACHVKFRNLSEYEILNYIKTKEPMDKAGAYGIQGAASEFVESIDGDFSCVVGLPKKALSELLQKEFTFEGSKVNAVSF